VTKNAQHEQAMDTVISGRFCAERRMAEMQAESPKATGGKPYQATGSKSDPVTPTLAELGIDKHLADRARKYAAMTGLYSLRDCLWPSPLSRSDSGRLSSCSLFMFLILRVRHWLPVAGRTARARQHRSGAPTP